MRSDSEAEDGRGVDGSEMPEDEYKGEAHGEGEPSELTSDERQLKLSSSIGFGRPKACRVLKRAWIRAIRCIRSFGRCRAWWRAPWRLQRVCNRPIDLGPSYCSCLSTPSPPHALNTLVRYRLLVSKVISFPPRPCVHWPGFPSGGSGPLRHNSTPANAVHWVHGLGSNMPYDDDHARAEI